MKKSMKVMLILMLVGITKIGHGQTNGFFLKAEGSASGHLEYGEPYEPFVDGLKNKADMDAHDQCNTNPYPFVDIQRITSYSIERGHLPYFGYIYQVSALYRCFHSFNGEW